MNKKVDFQELNKSDIYSIAATLLYFLQDSPKYKSISELFYILDYENFIKLIKFYGGEVIKIPSFEELEDVLKVLLVYQYSEIEGLSWEDSLAKSNVLKEDSVSFKNKIIALKRILKNYRIGGRDYK